MMLQLNPPLPVDTPRGPAYAHMAIDYSQEHYVLSVCFLCDSGECWVVPNRDVSLQRNLTMGVRVPANNASAGSPMPNPGTIETPLNRTTNFYPPLLNGNGVIPHES